MKARTVAVLGGGSWGTALADVLARNGHQTCIWARDPATADEIRGQSTNRKYLPGAQLAESLDCTTDLGQTLEGAEFVLLACPSHALRGVLGLAEPHLAKPIVISAAKGIEIGTDLRMSEVIAEVLGQEILDRFAVFSGPSFADEILRRLPTAVVAAAASKHTAVEVQDLFQNSYLRVYTQPDMIGVEFGGSLKNIIALAAGISDGIRLGSNARAALITRGLAEITRLACRFGAEETTLAGLAGLGDLVLTCTGDLSRNRTVGLAIGQGEALEEILAGMRHVVEGVRTAKAAHELAVRHGVEMPLVEGVYSILYESVEPHEALARLMAREPKPERWS